MDLLDAVDAEGIPIDQLPVRAEPLAKLRQVWIYSNVYILTFTCITHTVTDIINIIFISIFPCMSYSRRFLKTKDPLRGYP